MADPLDLITVRRPRPGWVTIVAFDAQTGLSGQIAVNHDLLPVSVRTAIEDGLDTAVRARAAELEGTGTWLDYTADQARKVISHA